MKYLKSLGLAVAAAALMALVGSSTASATILCKTNPKAGIGETTGTVCPSGSAFPAHTTIEAKLTAGTKAKLVTAFKTVECSKSAVKGETESEEGEPLTGPEGSLTFEECNCEVAVLHAGTLSTTWIDLIDQIKNETGEVIERRHTGSHNGTLSSTGNESTVTCSTIFGSVHCIYVTEGTDIGTLTGSSPATLKAEAVIPRLITNLQCLEKSEWSASYEVTSPKPLFVASGTNPAIRCEKVAKGEGSYTTDSDCTLGVNQEPSTGEWKRVTVVP